MSEGATEEYQSMTLVLFFLRATGCWPRWSRSEDRKERIYFVYFAFLISSFFVYCVIVVYTIMLEYPQWTSLDRALEDIVVIGTAIIVVMKMALLIANQKSLQDSIDYINFHLNPKYIQSEEDRKEMMACVNHERLILRLYVGSSWVMLFVFTFASVVHMFKSGFTDHLEMNLPLKHPFQITSFPVFVITYTFQFFMMFINGQLSTTVDAFFACLVKYLSCHLRLVRNRISEQELSIPKFIVKYHRDVLALIQKVGQAFRNLLIFMFSVNSLLICVALLHITQVKEFHLLTYLKFVIYFSLKVFQLFLYCWYGQEVSDRSADVSYACYSTHWYGNLRNPELKNLKIIQTRANKPIRMKAGFFVVGVASLKNVINSSYSIFTTFRQLNKAEPL